MALRPDVLRLLRMQCDEGAVASLHGSQDYRALWDLGVVQKGSSIRIQMHGILSHNEGPFSMLPNGNLLDLDGFERTPEDLIGESIWELTIKNFLLREALDEITDE